MFEIFTVIFTAGENLNLEAKINLIDQYLLFFFVGIHDRALG
jgi:hypothetical protein